MFQSDVKTRLLISYNISYETTLTSSHATERLLGSIHGQSE